jgi:hypothetical protein
MICFCWAVLSGEASSGNQEESSGAPNAGDTGTLGTKMPSSRLAGEAECEEAILSAPKQQEIDSDIQVFRYNESWNSIVGEKFRPFSSIKPRKFDAKDPT